MKLWYNDRERKAIVTEETRRLFDEDAYQTGFSAVVLDCQPNGKGGFEIVLDKTCFFPEGGGQYPDRGVIGDFPVMDVQERQGVIYHTVSGEIPVGALVMGEIDGARRFDFMQQHSGEHIFSGIAHSRFGANNVGFHLGESEMTVDLDVPLSEDDILGIERSVNECVWKNLPIEITYPTKEELSVLPYRSKKELTGKVRIVTIPGYDICACCGTHVRKTGEIGLVKVTAFQNYKGGTRLTMLCGKRALLDYEWRAHDINAATSRLSVKPEELELAITRLENEITERKISESALRRELFERKAAELGSGKRCFTFEPALSPDEMRRFALVLAERFTVAGVFTGEGGNWRFAIASKIADTAPFASLLRKDFSGRGGGKPELCQGTCGGSAEELKKALENL